MGESCLTRCRILNPGACRSVRESVSWDVLRSGAIHHESETPSKYECICEISHLLSSNGVRVVHVLKSVVFSSHQLRWTHSSWRGCEAQQLRDKFRRCIYFRVIVKVEGFLCVLQHAPILSITLRLKYTREKSSHVLDQLLCILYHHATGIFVLVS